MVSLEEMTRRRDHWRATAERLAVEVERLELLGRGSAEQAQRQRTSIENLNSALASARREAAAHLGWVRSLQKDVEHWKQNNKVLVRWFMRVLRKEGWRGDSYDCAHCPEGSCVLALWRADQGG